MAIEGKLISRSYTNEVGVKCYVTEIVASEILLLGTKSGETSVSDIQVTSEEVNGQEYPTTETPSNGKMEDAQEDKKSQRTNRRSTSKRNEKVA